MPRDNAGASPPQSPRWVPARAISRPEDRRKFAHMISWGLNWAPTKHAIPAGGERRGAISIQTSVRAAAASDELRLTTRDTKPTSAEALFATGNAAAARGDYHGALAYYEQVRALRPADPMVYTNIGAALAQLRRLDAAVTAYQRALDLKADLHATSNNLGNALRDLGRFDAARDAYRRAIRLAPENGAYYWNLVKTERLSADDPHLLTMERLAHADMPLTLGNRIFLHFALGQALADIAENTSSFRHLLAGNALQRGRVAYD